MLTSTCPFLQLSVNRTSHITLFHSLACIHPFIWNPLILCILYQMLLTSHIRKHVYPYIPEKNFEPSN